MNYLAHLFVARGSAEFRAGALAGDFVRGVLPPEASDEFTRGIRQHRSVDAFTDSHPQVRKARQRLPQFRHLSRVIVDVFFDHYLASGWSRWSPQESLRDFATRAYGDLLSQLERMPAEMRLIVQRMSTGDWLTSYGEQAAVRRALSGISVRLSRPRDLAIAADVLGTPVGEELRADFELFFPEVLQFVRREKAS